MPDGADGSLGTMTLLRGHTTCLDTSIFLGMAAGATDPTGTPTAAALSPYD